MYKLAGLVDVESCRQAHRKKTDLKTSCPNHSDVYNKLLNLLKTLFENCCMSGIVLKHFIFQ